MDRRRLVDRFRDVDNRLVDAFIAFAITFVGVGSQFADTTQGNADFRDTDLLAVVIGLFACVPVFWRRRAPLPALVVSAAAVTVVASMDYPTGNLPLGVLFLCFGLGAYAPRRDAWIGLSAVAIGLVTIRVVGAPDYDLLVASFNAALFGGGWMAGQLVRTRSAATTARLAEAEERAEAQRQHAARAVAEERLRIAQELHDVVAHSMSVIAVQAGMGVHVIDTRPDDAKQALASISATSRQTLQEMRRLLGVLRGEDGDRSNAPAPGIGDLPALVADVQATGTPVTLSVEGEPCDIPHGVELSVYRLVQEGLTNVIKHAGKASAAVTLRYQPCEVEVEIVDDGRGAAAAAGAASGSGSGGHGLLGMRERVAVWGGTLDVGPRPGGGFRVLATVPFADPA